jgi:transposase
MKKGKKKLHNEVVFKPYEQNQMWLLPPSLGELIPEHHIVRLVNEAIEGMDMSLIVKAYEGGGASNYHPKLLLKALVYGYIEKVYSSRKIEKALKENICFMWLCGMQQPDHNTINRFRKGQLKNTVKDVFAQVLLYLIEKEVVKIEDYYVDGTKIESAANRYTFVWAKNVARYKKGLLEKIANLVEQIDRANESEEAQALRDEQGVPLIQDSEGLQSTICKLNEQLEDEFGRNKKLKKQLKKLEEEHLKKLQEYEEHERKLRGRSSYSKTDEDATFMRMKEDHMKNGQLKPAYNIQIGTSEQFIINYTIHQTTTDWPIFIPHMEDSRKLLEQIGQPLPKRVVADAGYGSEQNYDYIAEQGIENYMKYPGFFQEQKKRFKQNTFLSQNLFFNEAEDFYVCPMGQRLTYRYTKTVKSKLGYESKIRVYQAGRCEGCPLRGMCHKAQTNRMVNRNQNLQKHRKQAKENLWSLPGIRLRKQRNFDVEAVFGHIKSNRGFKRFLLRSMPKVNIEFGLLAIAHNIKKWWAALQFAKIIPLNPKTKPPKPNSPLNNLLILKKVILKAFYCHDNSQRISTCF